MIKIKTNDFLAMSVDEQRELHESGNINMGGMWISELANGGIYNDDQYLIIFDDCVIHKSGRKIDGVQMTDETCAWYAKRGRNYVDDDGDIVGKSVNDVCDKHYNN